VLTDRIAILSAVRTPIGRFLGAFSDLSAADLGVVATRRALEVARVAPEEVDELVLGNARQAGGGPNPARQVAVRAGLGEETPAYTVNKACGSGLKAILLGAQSLLLGDATIVVAGGAESMTRVPYLLERARQGYRLGHGRVTDAMYQDGFLCPLAEEVMGATAETLARQYNISRAEQDAFALESQRHAADALDANRFADEIAPVELPAGAKADGGGRAQGGPPRVVTRDEHPRANTTLESLATLPPVFSADGTVTAGNSSGITDGAAALVLTTEAEAKRRGTEPLAYIEAWASAGVSPKVMGIGPVPAVHKLLVRTGGALDRFDLIELNEAFAAQVLAVDRDLRMDRARLNVNGGAIALGHPIGATGARILVTLVHEMKRRGAHRGLATLCISGGMGLAASVVRE
jgi:acetyl-CoA C-acetyltransferase